MGRLAAVAGLAEPFILIITPPDLFTIRLIALVAAPDLLAEMSSAIGANKPDAKMLVVLVGRPSFFRRSISS